MQAANGATIEKPEQARQRTADADARVMKMGDGGYRPAFNVQLATTCEDQVIVGVEVSNTGSDMAQMAPMFEQVIERTGTTRQWLVDGASAHEQIEAVARITKGQTEAVIARCPSQSKADKATTTPARRRTRTGARGPEPVAQWRACMAGDDQIAVNGITATECVNALARNCGLQRMPVRGLGKVRAVASCTRAGAQLMRMARSRRRCSVEVAAVSKIAAVLA